MVRFTRFPQSKLCAAVERRNNQPVSRFDFLRQMPLFAGLTNRELTTLAQELALRHFRSGETIFHEGDPGQVFYLIQSGQVRIYLQGEEGQETSVILYGAGDVFGELAVIDELPRSASAVAMGDTLVYTMSRDILRAHMREMPLLANNFMKALSVRVRSSTRHMGDLTLLDVPARLASKLLELAQDYGQVESDGIRIDAPLTQTDLASLTGATRESVNKALSAFRRQGLIRTVQGQIVILNPELLAQT
jgi:CRP/FNR family transcriptional regulator, cyclic AMP receptor protein